MGKNKSIIISIKNADFNCRVLGYGEKNIIAFHGFGQDGDAFLSLAESNPELTIYSIDLPFHGKTHIKNPYNFLSIEEILILIEKLIDQADLKHFSLIGFSIGAKYCFPILEKLSTSIDKLWLLAPDGITTNFWYNLATGSLIMRRIFRYFINHPKVLIDLGELLKSMNLLDPKILTFVEKSISTTEKRYRVYKSWTYMKNLRWKNQDLKTILNKSGVIIYFVLGDRDTVISKDKIEKTNRSINNSHIISLQSGHQNLIKNFSEWILENQKY